MIDFPTRMISQCALTLIQQALPYCEEEMFQFIMRKCEVQQMSMLGYNVKYKVRNISTYVNHMYKINSALMAGPPQLQIMCHYIT